MESRGIALDGGTRQWMVPNTERAGKNLRRTRENEEGTTNETKRGRTNETQMVITEVPENLDNKQTNKQKKPVSE